MRKVQMFWGCLCLPFLFACHQNEFVGGESADDSALRIQASITKSALARTNTEQSGVVTFEESDKIGFYMPESSLSVQWTYTDGEWIASENLFWPDKVSDWTFQAYYPFTEAVSRTNITMPNLSLQDGTLKNIGKYDFLTSSVVTNYASGSGVVAFTGKHSFKHAYCLLMVTLKEEQNSGATRLKEVSLSGEDIATLHRYKFDEGAGSMEKIPETPSVNKLMFAPDIVIPSEGHPTVVLINPSDLETPLSFMAKYERADKSFEAGTVNLGSRFESGKFYKISVKIRKEGLVIEDNSVEDWVIDESLGEVIVDETPAE